METTDLTIEVLKEIREEVHSLGSRVDSTNERLDSMREELSRRIVESEIRTSTAIADLAGTVREMTSVLRAANDLRPRVERCEHDIAEIKRRVG
jgi:predicted  nucleic acid-binding Zn-ribbon protein